MQSCRFCSIFKLGWTACKRVAPALFVRRSDAIWGRSFAAEPHGTITISTFCPCICAYRPDHHLCSIWCASACLRQAAKAGHAPAVHLLAVLKSSKQATSSFTWKQTRTMRVYTQASKSPMHNSSRQPLCHGHVRPDGGGQRYNMMYLQFAIGRLISVVSSF